MTKHFRYACLFIICFAIVSGAQTVTDSSYIGPDGLRVLRHSIVIPTTQREVWVALTTTEGVKSWAVPVAQVDFRVGGIWESSYDKNASIGAPGNIQNKFLSYVPMRMLSMQAVNAPPTFQHPEVLKDIFTVIEIETLSPTSVRITGSMVGFKNNEAHDTVYAFFARGNATSLQNLYDRFTKGPRKW
jgi:uncharacterized protein YndB with AHSA1/START domain